MLQVLVKVLALRAYKVPVRMGVGGLLEQNAGVERLTAMYLGFSAFGFALARLRGRLETSGALEVLFYGCEFWCFAAASIRFLSPRPLS